MLLSRWKYKFCIGGNVEIKIINPRVYTLGNGVIVGVPLDGNDEQLQELIKKILLSRSIIPDKIEIKRKLNKWVDVSAQELLDGC
jgi:hypothetical protein